MPVSHAASCYQLLENASSPLLERARSLQRLEKTVLGLLPASLAPHCKVLNLKNEILVLGTGSAAWAARLRFIAPELLRQLQCQFPGSIRTMQVRVRPRPGKTTPPPTQKLKISLKNSELLANTARAIEHPGLQEALYRIAAKASDS